MSYPAASMLLPRDAVAVLQRAAENAKQVENSFQRARIVDEAVRWVKSRYPQFFKPEVM